MGDGSVHIRGGYVKRGAMDRRRLSNLHRRGWVNVDDSCSTWPELELHLSPDRPLRGGIGRQMDECSTNSDISLTHFAISYR